MKPVAGHFNYNNYNVVHTYIPHLVEAVKVLTESPLSPSYIHLTTTAETIDFVGFSQVKNSQVSQKMCNFNNYLKNILVNLHY